MERVTPAAGFSSFIKAEHMSVCTTVKSSAARVDLFDKLFTDLCCDHETPAASTCASHERM